MRETKVPEVPERGQEEEEGNGLVLRQSSGPGGVFVLL